MPNVMAALPSIDGALRESCVILFLAQRRKLWLTAIARVPCSNRANVAERKTWTQSEFCSCQNSVRRQETRKRIYSIPAQQTAKHRGNLVDVH